MRADDVTYLAFRVRLTAPNGVVAEGECFAVDGHSDPERVRRTIIDLFRTGADTWEFASTEAG